MDGYKARSLLRIKEKGLPSLCWVVIDARHAKETLGDIELFMDCFDGRWALRTDAPENTGKILPLFGSNKHSIPIETANQVQELVENNPEYTFILSEAPNDEIRDSNIVCWRDGDYLFGEIGFQPMTLRDAWVRGRLCPFVITGGPQDVIRNKTITYSERGICYGYFKPLELPFHQFRLDYLRKIRELIFEEGYEYEISVCHDGRIIFWQESFIKENRKNLMNNILFKAY